MALSEQVCESRPLCFTPWKAQCQRDGSVCRRSGEWAWICRTRNYWRQWRRRFPPPMCYACPAARERDACGTVFHDYAGNPFIDRLHLDGDFHIHASISYFSQRMQAFAERIKKLLCAELYIMCPRNVNHFLFPSFVSPAMR